TSFWRRKDLWLLRFPHIALDEFHIREAVRPSQRLRRFDVNGPAFDAQHGGASRGKLNRKVPAQTRKVQNAQAGQRSPRQITDCLDDPAYAQLGLCAADVLSRAPAGALEIISVRSSGVYPGTSGRVRS